MKTKDLILAVAVELWGKNLKSPNNRQIADEIGMTGPAILYHFDKSVVEMRNQIAAHAVKVGKTLVIRQLIAEEHVAVASMSAEKKLSFFDGTVGTQETVSQ